MQYSIRDEVEDILESRYQIDFNTAEKVIDLFWEPGFLPSWYFISNSAADIAKHLYATFQLLTAETEMLRQVSEDGFSITYVMSVGYDFPGRLARVIEENLDMRIGMFDSVKSAGGVSFITLERQNSPAPDLTSIETEAVESLKSAIALRFTPEFAASLSLNYLLEELKAPTEFHRAERHAGLFTLVRSSGEPAVQTQPSEDNAMRTSIAFPVHDLRRCCNVLEVFKNDGINIERAYYDL